VVAIVNFRLFVMQLEEARSHALNPSKVEAMKAEISKELEEPMKAHMLAMDKVRLILDTIHFLSLL